MNTAINPQGESEVCTRSTPPFFEGDEVSVRGKGSALIDTVDVDGDESRCRVRFGTCACTDIVPVSELRVQ